MGDSSRSSKTDRYFVRLRRESIGLNEQTRWRLDLVRKGAENGLTFSSFIPEGSLKLKVAFFGLGNNVGHHFEAGLCSWQGLSRETRRRRFGLERRGKRSCILGFILEGSSKPKVEFFAPRNA